MCFPARRRGLFAKMRSFLENNSAIADGEDRMSTGRDPNRRVKIGPYCWESFSSVRCNGCLIRWRWPIIGSGGGDGGVLFGEDGFCWRSFRRRRERLEAIEIK